jgi:hypothetical protein
MDNFVDQEVILRRAEEVGEFLSEVSGSASTCLCYKFIVCLQMTVLQHEIILPPIVTCLLQLSSGFTLCSSHNLLLIASLKIP